MPETPCPAHALPEEALSAVLRGSREPADIQALSHAVGAVCASRDPRRLAAATGQIEEALRGCAAQIEGKPIIASLPLAPQIATLTALHEVLAGAHKARKEIRLRQGAELTDRILALASHTHEQEQSGFSRRELEEYLRETGSPRERLPSETRLSQALDLLVREGLLTAHPMEHVSFDETPLTEKDRCFSITELGLDVAHRQHETDGAANEGRGPRK